jgi:hypothetical protein
MAIKITLTANGKKKSQEQKIIINDGVAITSFNDNSADATYKSMLKAGKNVRLHRNCMLIEYFPGKTKEEVCELKLADIPEVKKAMDWIEVTYKKEII